MDGLCWDTLLNSQKIRNLDELKALLLHGRSYLGPLKRALEANRGGLLYLLENVNVIIEDRIYEIIDIFLQECGTEPKFLEDFSKYIIRSISQRFNDTNVLSPQMKQRLMYLLRFTN